MDRQSKALIAITMAAVIAMCPVVADACPTCKEGLGDNSINLVRGFGWSIIFMMSMPFLVLGGIGGYFYLEVRRAQRERDQQTDLLSEQPKALGG